MQRFNPEFQERMDKLVSSGNQVSQELAQRAMDESTNYDLALAYINRAGWGADDFIEEQLFEKAKEIVHLTALKQRCQ